MKCLLSFSIIIFCATSIFSQSKFEREYKVQESDVPQRALQFLDQLGTEQKVKWYAEESQDGKSFEAKTIKKSKLFSIEFDTLGALQDVEIEIEESEIPKMVFTNLCKHLDSIFLDYKFRKIQLQYSGPDQVIIDAIQRETISSTLTTKYEIITKGRNESGTQLYEITFDKNGEMIKKAVIVFKSSDHLEY